MHSWVELATAILTAAGMIAGALKLLARELRKAIEKHGDQVQQNTQALDRLTTSLDAPIEHGPADAQAHTGRPSNPKLTPKAVSIFFAAALAALALSGCTGADARTLHNYDRNRQAWEEDRRPDLDPELVKSRLAEFDAQKRYEASK